MTCTLARLKAPLSTSIGRGINMFKPVTPTAIAAVTGVTFFNATVAGFAGNYCVYEVWQGETLQYIGTCKLSQFFMLPDAQGNALFMKTIGRDGTFNARIIATGTRIDCIRYRLEHAKSLPDIPPCNKHGAFGRFTGIECIEDGLSYRSQTECAKHYRISQGNLSSHLRGQPGYATVGGKTFRKVAL